MAVPEILVPAMLIAKRIAGVFVGPEIAAPVTTLLIPGGIAGLLVGLAWMWRIYKAPTKSESAHWRFHDHN